MAQIKITKKIQGYIIEELTNDNIIPSGTRIYCGYCGHDIGTTKQEIKMPFTWVELESILVDNSIMVYSRQGVHHKKCGHVVSFNAGNLRFTRLSDYTSWFNEESNETSEKQ